MKRTANWPAALTGLLLVAVVIGAQLSGLTDLLGSRTVSGSSYELKTVTLQDGTQTVARWNACQKDITYKVNLSGVPAARKAAVLAEIKAGVTTLAAADGMTYRYAGTTSYVPQKDTLTKAPAELVIAAVDRGATDLNMADSSLGFGGVVWTTWNNAKGEGAVVQRGYVVLNADSFVALKHGFGAGMTQGNVILHELGHASGLEHAGASDEIMFATLTSGSPAGYQAGDLAALAKVGKAAGCIAVPAHAGLKDLS